MPCGILTTQTRRLLNISFMNYDTKDQFEQRKQAQLNILNDIGYPLHANAVVLDLGCGTGHLVQAYKNGGYDAYGCDFEYRPDVVQSLKDEGRIKIINTDVYRLPFEDNTFDFVFSDQVFEHVIDYATTLAELKRVLKPDGFSLHFFPSKYKPIEVHIGVPFSSLIRQELWLKLWARMGVRNQFQKEMSVDEVVAANKTFLNTYTNYLDKSEIYKNCMTYFKNVRFCEDHFIKYSQRLRSFPLLLKVFPFLPSLYSFLHARVLFLTNKEPNSQA